ncbi:MAG: PQQ-binding-like beta-propeller repeat protein [Verrucomicrobiia bacterium]
MLFLLKRIFSAVFLYSIICLALATQSEEWNQYHGKLSNSISKETGLKSDWSGGLPVLWKVKFNGGFSSFSIGGNVAYTLDKRSAQGLLREVCVAFNANNGELLWSQEVGVARYDYAYDASPYDGPRGTPAVVDGKVYVLNAQLVLYCLDANYGKILWQKDLVKEEAAQNIGWQNAASPIVEDGLIFICCGSKNGSLMGIDKDTGRVVWKTGDFGMTHSTPTIATIHNTRQVIFFTQQGLVSVMPQNGKILWKQSFPRAVSTAISPVVGDDIVYCSAGYGVGSAAYKIVKSGNDWSVKELWRKPGNRFCNQWSTPVYYNGFIYGIFGFKQYKTAPLKCVEIATGNERWSKDGFGMGNVILAERQLIVLSDTGNLYMIEANPSEYKEIGKIKALNGNCWSTPALSDGRLFLRSHSEGVCLAVTQNKNQ